MSCVQCLYAWYDVCMCCVGCCMIWLYYKPALCIYLCKVVYVCVCFVYDLCMICVRCVYDCCMICIWFCLCLYDLNMICVGFVYDCCMWVVRFVHDLCMCFCKFVCVIVYGVCTSCVCVVWFVYDLAIICVSARMIVVCLFVGLVSGCITWTCNFWALLRPIRLGTLDKKWQ